MGPHSRVHLQLGLMILPDFQWQMSITMTRTTWAHFPVLIYIWT